MRAAASGTVIWLVLPRRFGRCVEVAEQCGADGSPAEQKCRGDGVEGGAAVVPGQQRLGGVQGEGQQAAQVHQAGG